MYLRNTTTKLGELLYEKIKDVQSSEIETDQSPKGEHLAVA